MTVEDLEVKECAECGQIGNEDGTRLEFDNKQGDVFFECPDCNELFCLKCDKKHKHAKCGEETICDDCWEEHKQNCE